MSNIDFSTKIVNRRRFLGMTGGLAAAAGVAAACGDGGTWDPVPTRVREQQAAAAPTVAAGSSDHSMPMPSAADRPKPSGKLTTVYDAALAPVDPNPNKTLLIEAKDAVHEVAGGVTMNAQAMAHLHRHGYRLYQPSC